MLFFAYLIMASMWNLLAGFGGLVSIGQQAYIGIGAYSTMVFAQMGVQIFLAVLLAAVTCAVFAIPTSLLAFRLRGDYFAVGTWVIAEVYRLIVVKIPGLGGPSGGRSAATSRESTRRCAVPSPTGRRSPWRR